MRGIGLIVLAVIGSVWYIALPPRARASAPLADGLREPVRGVIHIHSRVSDGTGTVDDIAAAASRAGLKFIIVTDHGDGTRSLLPPQYKQGVLSIEGTEISTDGGHIVVLNLPHSPYRLGGETLDVLADIARLGGFSIAAHPGSEKPALRWADWTSPVDGLEWINADSEWRDEAPMVLVRALLTYPFRQSETLAHLLDRPEDVLRHWDELTRQRRVVGLAAADAHAHIGMRSLSEPYDNGPALHLPSYEAVFRTFSIALPDIELSGNAAQDARAVVDAIRAGHVYSTIDAIGGRAAMTFTAMSGSARAVAGDELPVNGPVTLRVEAQAPPDATIAIKKDGATVASGEGAKLEYGAGTGTGVYRVEIELPGAPGTPPVPWIVSNPIYVGQQHTVATAADPHRAARAFSPQYDNGEARAWTIETSPNSAGAIDVVPSASGGTELSLRYALSGTVSMGPYVAFIMPAGRALASHDRLMFTARANGPTRLSVQLRAPVGELGERWHRSVYIDAEPKVVTVYFDDLAPRGPTRQPKPTLSDVQSVMFVIDTVNTSVGASGQIWIDDVKYGR